MNINIKKIQYRIKGQLNSQKWLSITQTPIFDNLIDAHVYWETVGKRYLTYTQENIFSNFAIMREILVEDEFVEYLD